MSSPDIERTSRGWKLYHCGARIASSRLTIQPPCSGNVFRIIERGRQISQKLIRQNLSAENQSTFNSENLNAGRERNVIPMNLKVAQRLREHLTCRSKRGPSLKVAQALRYSQVHFRGK